MNLIKTDGKPMKQPNPWSMLMKQWIEMVFALKLFLLGTEKANEWLLSSSADDPLSEWCWMWTLQPDSEARKAAFTAGHAAVMLARYRMGHTDAGRVAEQLIRVLVWHIDDARGEQHTIKTLGFVSKPNSESRVYRREEHQPDLIRISDSPKIAGASESKLSIARFILADHLEHSPEPVIINEMLKAGFFAEKFAESAVATLPDGPWVMTSADVSRFLLMLLEAP